VTAAGDIGNTAFDYTEASAFENNFDRLAVYGSYPLGKYFFPMAGFMCGRDDNPVSPAAFPATSTLQMLSSKGAFVDGVVRAHEHLAAGLRFDRFDPNPLKSNLQWAVTPYVNIPLNNGFQLIAEYQHRDFQIDATHNRQNDTFQVRVIFIQ
jgi:hypothetical protein